LGLRFALLSRMRTPGSPIVLEYRRRLAVQRIDDGYSIQEVADFLGVDPSSVCRWLAASRRQDADGLSARPVPGRPPKLTSTQEKIACRWLADNPTEHGFATELWSAPRLARLIEQEWGVHFNPDYLTTWLRQRGFTPQEPRRVARERDEAIARWLAQDWPRIKKRRGGGARTSC
jgi:transposase